MLRGGGQGQGTTPWAASWHIPALTWLISILNQGRTTMVTTRGLQVLMYRPQHTSRERLMVTRGPRLSGLRLMGLPLRASTRNLSFFRPKPVSLIWALTVAP